MPRASKAEVKVEGDALTFTFINGKVLDVSLEDVSTFLSRLALHGLEQKLRDSYAGAKTVDEAYALAAATLENLRNGEWSKRREGGPREEPIDLLVKALETVLQRKKKPIPADLKAKVEALDRSARAKLRGTPEVAAEIARLKGGKGETLAEVLGL